MSVFIALRDDYDSIELRCLAKHMSMAEQKGTTVAV